MDEGLWHFAGGNDQDHLQEKEMDYTVHGIL